MRIALLTGWMFLVVGCQTPSSPGQMDGSAEDGGTTSSDGASEADASSQQPLAGILTTLGRLEPAFDPAVSDYRLVGVPFWATTVSVAPIYAAGTQGVTLAGVTLLSGAPSAAISIAGNVTIELVVTPTSGAQRIYRIAYTRVAAPEYLKAPIREADDRFGRQVSIDGDTMVISADKEDSDAVGVNGDQTSNAMPDSGAAYVYRRGANGWQFEAYLKAGVPKASRFSLSAAISGNTVVIGTFAESSGATTINGDESDTSAPGSGAAWVFTRSGTTWTREAFIKAPDSVTSLGFGVALAIDRDTLVVGAVASDVGGRAYVFRRSQGVWTFDTSWTGVDVNAGLGRNLAVHGNRVAVASPGQSAVFLYERESNGTWSEVKRFDAPEVGAGINFATALALSSDVLAVGESRFIANVMSGRVHVFVEQGGVWSAPTTLEAAPQYQETQFGQRLVLDGAILALGSASNPTGMGCAYVFERSAGAWVERARVVAPNGEPGDDFGTGIGWSDGQLVVGAFREGSASATDPMNNDAPQAGAVYVFR